MNRKYALGFLLSILTLGLQLITYSQKPAIITVDELTNNTSQYCIIAVSNDVDFARNHINGAQRISRSDFTINNGDFGGLMAKKPKIEKLLDSLNINTTDTILFYDYKGGCDAARAKWILDYYGHANSYLLDGGMNGWHSKNYLPNIKPTTDSIPYQFSSEPNTKHFADLADVKEAINNPNCILIDTRTLDEYRGITQKDGAFRAGHIPTAIHIDWVSNINYDGDQTFLPKETLAELYAKYEVTADKEIICYCHSGVRSAHSTFVLTEILGFENVKNYDGSWIEWSYHNELEIDTTYIPPVQDIYIESYSDVFFNSFKNFGNYTWQEITFQVNPWYVNYFWWLIVLSLIVWGLELVFPWRKNQPAFRKDFWLDAFFMFFNFYIFKLIIFMAFSNITAKVFHDLTGSDATSFALFDMSSYPLWSQLLIFFIATDFIQWFTHVILHRFNFFWRFHKVHHSVEQMGFAAHLRYHWMENVFYTPMKYIMVMLIGGFTPDMAYIVFYIAIAIGHLNHANIGLDYGPFKYLINNPKMHIWHHAHDLPKDKQYGVNFGISLSIWDYIFKTNYIPSSGRDIKLGFAGMEKYPKKFLGLLFSGFGKTPDEK